MTHLKNARLALLTLALSSLVATTAIVRAQQALPEDTLRELGIMRNIFGAALQSDGQRGGNRFGMNMGAPEALYLAGQGMVFTFHLNGGGGYFNLNGAQIVIPPAPPAPVVSFTDDFAYDFDYDFDFDMDFDFDFEFGDANGYNAEARQRAQDYRQQVTNMNEDIRLQQQELRELQREIRDLQQEERRQDVDNSAKIAETEAAMESAMEALQGEATRMRQLQQEYQAERLAAFEALRAEQTAVIFSTLCDYGNTLRSLASGEHVSIVLRNYADGQTQVNVFDYADISSCTSVDSLRQAATTYIQDYR